jgi:hypothetical protein
MSELQQSFISRSFLRSVWAHEFETFKDSPEEADLVDRLRRWAARGSQKETTAQAALLEEFFRATWGYAQSGQTGGETNYSLHPAFPVAGAGQRAVWEKPMPRWVSLHRMRPHQSRKFLSNSMISGAPSTHRRNEKAIPDPR